MKLTKKESLYNLKTIITKGGCDDEFLRQYQYLKYEIDYMFNLIDEHFELVDLIEKWGLNDLSIDEINKQTEAYKWIPTQLFGVKLPREDGRYLITLDDGFIAVANYIENEWELWADAGEVIAWLPLPKPYKEKE